VTYLIEGIAFSESNCRCGMSAGTAPGPRIHSELIAVIGEAGFDRTDAPTTKLTPELTAGDSMLITMGCGDQYRSTGRLIRDEIRKSRPGLGRETGLVESPTEDSSDQHHQVLIKSPCLRGLPNEPVAEIVQCGEPISLRIVFRRGQ
jgi:hypothetical protein